MHKWKSSKTPKERSQPSYRKNFGLLEKHKDYVLRARDYRTKKERLRRLKEKVFHKNPDEFYFKMVSKEKPKEEQPSTDAIKLMKTQDIAYATLKKTMEMKKIDKMQQSLHFIGSNTGNKHTVFMNNKEEVNNFTPEQFFSNNTRRSQ